MSKELTSQESKEIKIALFKAYCEVRPDSYYVKQAKKIEDEGELEDLAIEFFRDMVIDGIYGQPLPEGYKHLDQDGGGEGGAEDCQTVFEWQGKCYAYYYSYYSYDGYQHYNNSLYEVKPQEKVITVYV